MENDSAIPTDNPETDSDHVKVSNEFEIYLVPEPLKIVSNAIVDGDFTLYKSTFCKGIFDVKEASWILHLICKRQIGASAAEFLREAIRYGCDTRAKDNIEYMPIHVACSFANYHAVKFLADLDPSLCNEVVENSVSFSPLMMAIDKFSTEKADDFSKTVEVLVKYGAEVNTSMRSYSNTPLLSAVFHYERMPDIVRILLDAGADVTARSLMYRTPLILAVSQNDEQSVIYLLKAKSDPDAKDKMGWTPLRLACQKQYAPIIRDLVQYGADINCERNKNNKDILTDAIQTSHGDITALLFDLGLKVTPEIIMLQNPVVRAIRKRSNTHLKILLRENCPLDEPLHELPLIEAVQTNNTDADVLDTLIQSGADFSDALLDCALTARPGDEVLASLVARYHQDVRTLKTLCSFCVRKYLGLGIKGKVQRLVDDHVVPRSLVKDIMLEHVLNV
ncbi:ankyrin repeat domain-containing protein 17-like [Mizuhopecten yessoensis]|uniref:Ankyrin repeat protein n=1 Tax=Mizuhopecten yessoensis TaxID=6573 RepID=A0A210PL81_MIZYE|nr:ankyrin repeat domain-containing protein 17-like [Mizuhopecten yessoensis]OWF37227.1 Ankyrin repeat protein [Mizuhopecten yessoensis]